MRPCDRFHSVEALSCLERGTPHKHHMFQEHRIVHNRLSVDLGEDIIATSKNKTPLKLSRTRSKYGMFEEYPLDLGFVKKGTRDMKSKECALNNFIPVKKWEEYLHTHAFRLEEYSVTVLI